MSGRRVAGKVGLVTGAGSGIGEATVRLLAAEGAKVVVADVVEENAAKVARGIVDSGAEAVAVTADVGDPEQVRALVEETVSTFGRLDILHNNAAAMQYTPVDPPVAEVDLNVWNHQLAVNLTGPMLATKFAIPHMLRGGGGSIIHTASVEAKRASERRTGYSVTKAGLLGLSRSTAVQYGRQGIRSNVLLPGPTFGASTRERLGPDMVEFFRQRVMAPKTSEPVDQAYAVLFLASDESWFMNGQEVVVDGALTSYLPVIPIGTE